MGSFRNTCEIFKRELKSYFDSPVAYVFLISFLVLIGFFTFAPFLGNYYENGQANLRPFFTWHPWVYLLLIPAVSMRLWAEEKRSGTMELLLTLPITTTQAILGKFLASWLFVLLALGLTFPIIITTAYLGDPDGGVIAAGYIGSAMLAGTYLAVGMLMSSMTRNQVISFVLSLVACLFLLLVGWPPFTKLLVRWDLNWLLVGANHLSVMTHYQSMQRGILDLRDIGYYVSMIAVMLFATNLLLQSRKS